MASNNLFVVVALGGKVAALLKSNGSIHWSATLPGVMGSSFVTVTSDDTHVYAYTHGQIHCLDLNTGHVLWTNELEGYGHGIASICLPGAASAPDPSAFVQRQEDRKSSTTVDVLSGI